MGTLGLTPIQSVTYSIRCRGAVNLISIQMYNRTFKNMAQAYMATTCVLSDAAWGNLKTSSDQEEPGTFKQMSRISLGQDQLPAKTSNVDP
jgi:hypothetical protein